MCLRTIPAALLLSAIMLAALGIGPATAAPSNAPGATSDIFTCSDGTTVTIVSNGNGIWTPGHVVSIDGSSASQILIPLAFSGTFYPDDGSASFEVFSLVKNGNHNGVTNTKTCSMTEDVSADDPDNPFGVGGQFVFVATVFQAGDNR
jgi:hypothetical protein